MGCFGGTCLGVSRSSGLQVVGDAAEQIGLGAGGGEGDANTRGGLGDAGCDLEQPGPQSGELGQCERLGFWNGVAHRQHQPVGGGVQHEPHLIGKRRTATGAIRGKLALVQLDHVLGLTSGAVEAFVEPFRAAIRQGDWKLMWRPLLPSSVELYNIAQDPSEKNNVAAEHPEKVAGLQKRIEELASGSAKPLFLLEQFKAMQKGLQGEPALPNEDAYYEEEAP